MTEQFSFLYRSQIYEIEKHNEHLSFLAAGKASYLTIPQTNSPLYLPAKLITRAEQQIIAQITNKKIKTYAQYLFLIVALQLSNQSFHAELSSFKNAFPKIDHCAEIARYFDYFSRISPQPRPTVSKQSVKYHFQKLVGKGESEGYFGISEVPVFVISTNWLQHLYSGGQAHPPPITNEQLVQTVAFPLSDAKYSHYNYRIKEDLRQNEDFKFLPYQAWNYLFDLYGGFEVKRFTTKQTQPSIQVWHANVSILIVEERCIFHKLVIQVSKNDTFAELLERLKVILYKYKIVPEAYRDRKLSLFRSKELPADELAGLLQDDSNTKIINNCIEKINDFNWQIEEANIFCSNDILICNFELDNSIFSKLVPLKVIASRQKCFSCGSTEDLFKCKCQFASYCSSKCKMGDLAHLKECDSILMSNKKYNLVVEYYQCQRKVYHDMQIVTGGYVGLQNLGNTCYMNSALQCLLRLEGISSYFMANEHLKDLNVGNVLGSQGHIACSYGQLIKNFYNTSKRALEPSDILRGISKNPQFRGYNHQDSQQFLNYFLDKLHQDLNRVRVKPYTEDVESNGRPDAVVSSLSWQNYKKRNNSRISDYLAGQYRSEIRCPDCQRVSITFDPFMSVTLQFPKPQKGQLLEGYVMNQQGQFLKLSVEVKLSMLTYEFLQKYFINPVKGVYLKEKRIVDEWDNNKSIFQNKKSSGLLFFFQKQPGCNVQVVIQFYTPGTSSLEYFTRVIFVDKLFDEKQLMTHLHLVIRKPLQKALQVDLTQSQYLKLCEEQHPFNILAIDKDGSSMQYPVDGNSQIKVKVELIYNRVGAKSAPKLNVASSTKYSGKVVTLLKKLSKELSVTDLLHCFSEAEQLSQQNAWYCSVCKSHKLAQKVMSLYKLPEYLIVHLKRFNHRGDSGNRYIIYGEKVVTPISLNEFEVIDNNRYELVGVVNHVGSLMHGHYTATVKREEWFCYDDSRCSRSRLDGRNAYLLFYKRITES